MPTIGKRILYTALHAGNFNAFPGIFHQSGSLTFAVNMNVNTTETQPVGSIVVKRVPTGVYFDLTFTEMVVRDNLIMEPLLEAIRNGYIPVYNFQGVVEKPDGQEQRMAFNDAVPNGTFGLMSLTPGEIVQREHSFALNEVPKYISALASKYLNN